MHRVRGNFAVTFTAALCCLLLAACGGSGGGTGGNNNGTGTIGSTGGTVSLPSGPTVQVPAGALVADTPITVATSTITAPTGAVTQVFEFGPAGTTFAAPVTVTFPVPAGTTAANAAVYWTKASSTTQWDVLPTTVSGTTASATVTHFSAGFVGLACTTGAACVPTNACHDGVTTCNGTPACEDTGTSLADGTSCGTGGVCAAGVCGGAQCIDMAGSWTITAHCDPAYVGKSAVIAQTGCTISTTDPITLQTRTGQVVGNSTVIAGCQGSVIGDTWSLACGTCNQTIVRQPTCTPNQTCTPSGTVDPCKAYATVCDASGTQTCGASGNAPDGTTCGSGLVCTAGVCGSQHATDYVPVAVSRRYTVTSGATTLAQSNEALTDTPPTWTRKVQTLGSAPYTIQAFERSGGATYLTGSVSYNPDGSVNTSATYSPPQLIIPASTAAGATGASTSTATVTGVAPFTVTRNVTVNGLEPVTVSAGTFTALKVTTVISQSNVAAVTTNVAWYVDGVGQVKSVSTPTSGTTTTFDLTGYSPMACSNGTCACNALVNSAPLVDPVYVATSVPVASGGSILDGTYYLTANRVYTGIGGTTGPTGGQVKNTYSLQSGLMNWVGWHTGLTTDTRSTARITTSGNQVTAATTCGSEAGGVQGYTASTNQIQFIITNSCPGSTCDPGADAILTRQ